MLHPLRNICLLYTSSQSILLQKMQKQQEYLSYHDDLTGLMNRNSFVRYMSDVQKKEHKSLGAVSVDINGLKNFNREFGHEYGDEVVIRVGEVLEEHLDVYKRQGVGWSKILPQYMKNVPQKGSRKCIKATEKHFWNRLHLTADSTHFRMQR